MIRNDMSNGALLERIIELENKYAKLKRWYEYAIDNIDESNLATSLAKKIGDMETKINISATGVTSSVSDELVESMIQQRAGQITALVKNAESKMNSKIEMTAGEITAGVDGKIVDAVNGAVNEKTAQWQATMDGFRADVDDVIEKQNEVTGEMETIKNEYSQILQTADEISGKVGVTFGNVVDCYGVGVYDYGYGYVSGYDNTGKEKTDVMDTGKVYHYTDNSCEKYVYHNGTEWVSVDGTNLYSCFTQTRSGFKLKGDFTSTTNEGTTVDIGGTKIDIYNCQEVGEDTVPKLSIGFENEQETDVPFIRFGEGDGSRSVVIDGIELRAGQGIIKKTDAQFIIQYLAGIDGIGENSVAKYAGIYITRANDGGTTIDIKADKINLDGATVNAVAVFGG